MRPLIALLLLTPALVGCLGASDDGLGPSATGAEGELPTLPEGLEMEGTEVLEQSDTSIRWVWEATVGEPMPQRPVEDAFFALDQEVRQALVEVDP